jgi:hypothetical protein
MERRELYEPEDIEQLLIERPYDELLEMERAFVLRHLSGRDEYEAMRALLLKVHDDDAHMEPIDAEPSVRTHVLDVFRAEQRPQWRIWLNSVHVFLLPKEASAMWRPALALGSVALVAWLVVIGTQRMEQANAPQLAELKETKILEEEKAAKPKALEPPPAPLEIRTEQQQGTTTTRTYTDAPAFDADSDRLTVTHDLQASLAEKAVAEQPVPAQASEAGADLAKDEEVGEVTVNEELKAIAQPGNVALLADSVRAPVGTATHVVTGTELTYNFTAADATQLQTVETVSTQSAKRFVEREKAKKSEERKRSLAWDSGEGDDGATADAGAYIGLLRAAW